MNREEMIKYLTEYELGWFIQNEDQIAEVTSFFAKGGFNVWSDEELQKGYKNRAGEESGQ